MENIISIFLIIVGALMAATNIITEVLKKVTWNKIPTNLLVFIIAVALTLVTGAAYAQIKGIPILWYYVVAAVVVGLFVAYAAMFGFDKFKQAISQFGFEKLKLAFSKKGGGGA